MLSPNPPPPEVGPLVPDMSPSLTGGYGVGSRRAELSHLLNLLQLRQFFLPRLSSLGHFWRLNTSYFAECPSVGFVWCFLRDSQGLSPWQGCHRRDTPSAFLSHCSVCPGSLTAFAVLPHGEGTAARLVLGEAAVPSP